MINIDISELDKPHRLDDDDAALESAKALMGIAHTLARGSSAQAFCLLVATVAHFASESDARLDLLELALTMLSSERGSVRAEIASGQLIISCCPRKQWGDGEHDASCPGLRYEAERAADPDPRDEDDLESGGASC